MQPAQKRKTLDITSNFSKLCTVSRCQRHHFQRGCQTLGSSTDSIFAHHLLHFPSGQHFFSPFGSTQILLRRSPKKPLVVLTNGAVEKKPGALCPNFDEIMEGLNLIPGAEKSIISREGSEGSLVVLGFLVVGDKVNVQNGSQKIRETLGFMHIMHKNRDSFIFETCGKFFLVDSIKRTMNLIGKIHLKLRI